MSRVKDLPHGSVPLVVWVRKRRFACAEVLCERRSFTETSAQLLARARVTTRLKVKVCAAVTTTNRAVSEVAKDHGIAWWTVHRILVKAAADVLGQAAPTSMIGIDETRARSVRWIQEGVEKTVTWRRSGPWMTSIVDLDRSHPGGIIGLAAGRSGACVEGWIGLQSMEFRATVQVVAINPSAPYAAGIRRALPQARIVLDHFHLVMLGNAMVTDVRQRALREQQGRRGIKIDPAWAHRRLLLRTATSSARRRWPGSSSCSPPTTPRARSAPPGPARNSYASSWPRTARPDTAGTRPRTASPASWPRA